MLALFLCIGAYAEEKTSTLTFTKACGGSGTASDGAVWTVTSDAKESNFDNTRGIHYGTSSAAVSYLQLSTSGINGTITSIVVNASGASGTTAKLNVTVGDDVFGLEQSLSSEAKKYTLSGSASGKIVVRLSQKSAKKALYVKSIAVTYSTETPSGTQNPNNSFGGVTEYNATIGVGNTMPTFTTSSDGAITYESSKTDVATINNNGEITLLKAGTTTITAKTAQTATFAAGSASYNLIVAKGTPVLSFASETVTAYLGTDQNGPALTNPGDGVPTYTIDPDIATIQSNGYIQPKATGTATVTVTTSETEAWLSASVSYMLNVEEPFSVDAVGIYELVTDASTLKDGDQILIANTLDTRRKVLGVKNGNPPANYNATEVDVSDDKKTLTVSQSKSASVTAAVLEKAADVWYFHTNDGYLYAASSSANQLKASSVADVKNRASINIDDGNATIEFLGDYSRRYLKYNSQSDLFSCYGSSNNQTPVQLYRKIDTETAPTISFSPASGTEVNYGTQVTITARTATSITYSVNDGEAVTVNETSATVTINTHSTIKATATNQYGTCDPVTAEYTIHAESPAFTYDPTKYEITIGDDFTAPVLGKAADYDGTITYSSDNTEVAEVDAETGTVTVKGAGTATITATGTATEHFNAATASYTLTVKKQESSVSFAESVVEITYGDNYDKQKATTEGVNGNLVYTSSDESVVKFHGNNVIDVLKAGTVTITATAPATDTTDESSATYTLKIYEPADAVEGTTELLNEPFDDCAGSEPKEGYGGNSSGFTNAPASLTNAGWELTRCQAGDGYLKLTSGSGNGIVVTPVLDLNGASEFSFEIAPWVSETADVTVTLENATFEDGTSTLTTFNDLEQSTWKTKTFSIIGNGNVRIKLEASRRVFIDNFVVGGGAQPAHEINLTFSSAGYLTWVATADIDFSLTADVTAYQITEATSKKITMEEVDKVPAGAAVMLKGSGTVELKRTTGVAALSNNKMLACTDDLVTGNGVNGVTNTDVYVLGSGKSGLGFYMLKGTLQAGKGYLQVSEEGNAKDFIGFEITTGVKTIEIKHDDDAAIYNLQGIRVAHPQKGIYVKNGKKYVIK